ncbi:MAG: hypothetical protein JRJ85_13105 [Deltaproteobacteria bacterium]|nr:hypothetical protein [Deltaproteobacteria bacterium]
MIGELAEYVRDSIRKTVDYISWRPPMTLTERLGIVLDLERTGEINHMSMNDVYAHIGIRNRQREAYQRMWARRLKKYHDFERKFEKIYGPIVREAEERLKAQERQKE